MVKKKREEKKSYLTTEYILIVGIQKRLEGSGLSK